ncbi:hypothetical protein ABEB36_005460 [Hypothenemus hampei]|uniref:Uncharacterized protein n=1 Tax=Hypothenemus hampei TaxID=57062 RepID=A0ABD1EYN1_HYPHA
MDFFNQEKEDSVFEDRSSVNQESDFEELKQNFYILTQQLKVSDASFNDYKDELRSMEKIREKERTEFQLKVSEVEKEISDLKLSQSKELVSLEEELSRFDAKIREINEEIELLKKINKSDRESIISMKQPAEKEYLKENEILKQKCAVIQSMYKESEEQLRIIQDNMYELDQQLEELKEIITVRKEELQHKTEETETINEELLLATQELEIQKNKPLPDGSKGNSVFVQVEDRRVKLEKTVDNIQYNYIHLQQELENFKSTFALLHKDHAQLLLDWKTELDRVQNQNLPSSDSLVRQLEILEKKFEDQKVEMENQVTLLSRFPEKYQLDTEYQFYQSMINMKLTEITDLEERWYEKSMIIQDMAMSLVNISKELRLTKLNVLELQYEIKQQSENKIFMIWYQQGGSNMPVTIETSLL